MISTRKKRVAIATLVLGLMLSATTQAHAALITYTDQATFTAAQSGNTFIGTETFEESTLGPGASQFIDDPLRQGVANGPFPAGIVQPLTLQSNTLGFNATSPSPRGSQGLNAVSAGSQGSSSDALYDQFGADGMDLIFSPTQRISSVGFNPLNFGSNPVQVRVYDINNVLLGTSTTASSPGGTAYYGIQATGADLIGRVNLYGNSFVIGVDNISIYQAVPTPEPATWAMMGLGVIAMAFLAWRRKREEAEGSGSGAVEVSGLAF